MPIVYRDVNSLQQQPIIGSGQCVELVRFYTILKHHPTVSWKEGEPVMGADLERGTAIATFVDGRYPRREHGNHAAFFLSRGPRGFWIMDQWKSPGKLTSSWRFITSKGKNKDGTYIRASDNADAFSVIEICGANS